MINMSNLVETTTYYELVKQQYTVTNNFYYNTSNIMLTNVTYSAALKLVRGQNTHSNI